MEYMAAGLVPLVMDTLAHQSCADRGFHIQFFNDSAESFKDVIHQLFEQGFPAWQRQENLERITRYSWEVIASETIQPVFAALATKLPEKKSNCECLSGRESIMSERLVNNALKDMEGLIQENNLLLLEIQDLKEDQVNSGISIDSFRSCLDRKNELIVKLENTIEAQKEKLTRTETDIRRQKEKIRSQKKQIETQRNAIHTQKEKIKRCQADILNQKEKIRSQKKQIQTMRKNISTMNHSYAFLFGQAFVNAVKKPGMNTVLLPYRWIRLTLRQWL